MPSARMSIPDDQSGKSFQIRLLILRAGGLIRSFRRIHNPGSALQYVDPEMSNFNPENNGLSLSVVH